MGWTVSAWWDSTTHTWSKFGRGRAEKPAPLLTKHRLKTVRPYEYADAATLLADFWTAVETVLRERGVIP